MTILETPIYQLTGRQFVELTQGASLAAWAGQIGVVAFVVVLFKGVRRWWINRRLERRPSFADSLAMLGFADAPQEAKDGPIWPSSEEAWDRAADAALGGRCPPGQCPCACHVPGEPDGLPCARCAGLILRILRHDAARDEAAAARDEADELEHVPGECILPAGHPGPCVPHIGAPKREPGRPRPGPEDPTPTDLGPRKAS